MEADASKYGRLNILQIGDSHTAADHLSGRLRSLLQARFGNGGRGLLAPGVPHAWYRPSQVSVTQSAGWKILSSNKTMPDAAQFGLSGFEAEASAAGETISIEVKAGIDTFQVGYRWRPDGGKFEIVADGVATGQIETRYPADGRKQVLQSISGLSGKGADHPWRLEIRAIGDGPVDITDMSLLRTKGIRLTNLGFIGAQVSLMGRWHWPTVRAQLADLDPALIILAFGTNEGHAAAADIEARYARQLGERLAALKTAAPNASIVVVGTPDANRYPKFCLPPPLPAAGHDRLQPKQAVTGLPRRDRTVHMTTPPLRVRQLGLVPQSRRTPPTPNHRARNRRRPSRLRMRSASRSMQPSGHRMSACWRTRIAGSAGGTHCQLFRLCAPFSAR